MMKLPLENKQVERILSLIIILYGLRLIVPNVFEFVWYVQVPDDVSWAVLILLHIIVGCLLIVFFVRIVQVVGFFATEGKNRSERCWFLNEILAVPLILYAFTEFLFVLFYGIFWCAVWLYPCYSSWGIWCDWRASLVRLPVLLLYFSVAGVILFHARRIATWLLCKIER
jgi:hypothetical protein